MATSAGPIPTRIVVSNADYIHTFRMLRGGKGFSNEVTNLRKGKAEPSTSFFTIQLACDRSWDALAHHILVLTKGRGGSTTNSSFAVSTRPIRRFTSTPPA